MQRHTSAAPLVQPHRKHSCLEIFHKPVLAYGGVWIMGNRASRSSGGGSGDGNGGANGDSGGKNARTVIDEALATHKVMVFSKTYCPYCTGAKSALKSVMGSTQFGLIELDARQDGSDIQDELESITGRRSVPRVFIDGKFIGGGEETMAMAKNGELKKLLDSKGIL